MIDFQALFSISGQVLLYRIVAMLAIVAVHGYAIARLAAALGDPGPGYDGRRTLNPLAHLDPLSAFVQVFFRFGWIRPIAIDPDLIRGRTLGLAAIALASLAVLLALAAGLWAMRPLMVRALGGQTFGIVAAGMSETGARMIVLFVALNLIPLPPLTMGLVLRGLAPRVHHALTAQPLIAGGALAVFIVSGAAARVLAPLTGAIERALLP